MTNATLTFFAQPYNIMATGFYFNSSECFEDAREAHNEKAGQDTEEFEIQFINGAPSDAAFFKAVGSDLNQANVMELIEFLEGIENCDEAVAGACYLIENGISDLSDVLLMDEDDLREYVAASMGRYMNEEQAIEDYAHGYVEDTGMLSEVPENVRMYFDYSAFARDMRLSGDIVAYDCMGETFLMNGNM